MERAAFSYRFGTAEFDEARFELRVAGLPVEVERRALEVLAYLLQHAGEVVTKDELLREVWAGRITVDKVLPNAINKLRRALGEANAGHIATQARVGYRLEGPVTRTAVGRQFDSPLALAAGQSVPGRPNFELLRQLGRTAGSEVWLGEHQKTHEQRVYKFALDSSRLRSLKREVTLLRLLQEALDEPAQVVEVLDWNFEHLPFFLECRYGGQPLSEWAKTQLAVLNPPARIALFLQIADAVAAAHAVGVLHKDIKPANVLISSEGDRLRVRLTDFGSSHLLESDRLQQFGITRWGMTVEDGVRVEDSTSGTPLYLAPELFTGHAPTVRSDVYALGVLLYQLLTGRLGQPMAPGWEAEISDELLREDLKLATDGNPHRRMVSAADFADRLRRLEERRESQTLQDQAKAAQQRDREALARAQARRPFVAALVLVLMLGGIAAVVLQQAAVQARNAARSELQRAQALTRFLTDDLIGRANPMTSAQGPDTPVREVLLAARDTVSSRFGAQPEAEVAVRESLASLFSALNLFAEAEGEARQAVTLATQAGLGAAPLGLQARAVLAQALSRMGRRDEAQQQLTQLEQLTAAAGREADPEAMARLARVRSTLLVGRGDFAAAVGTLQQAIEWQGPGSFSDTAQRDALRLDLIFALSMTGQKPQAQAEGARLMAEAQTRAQGGDLLRALTQLALVRAQGEDHAAAERLLLAAQPVIVARLGDQHSRHISLLNELHGVAFRRGDWPRAMAYAEQVHTRAHAKFGQAHAITQVTLLNWARALNESGQPALALDKARRAHERLVQMVGAKGPQAQDAAFVLAMVELQLGHGERARALIEQLDAAVLESGRATGQWPAAIDALRGMALQLSGDKGQARALLDAALAVLKPAEEALSRPARLYVLAQAARSRLP